MENHSVNTKQKTKKTVILLAAFFLICAAGLGGLYAWKNVMNQSVEEKDENDNSNTNDKTATPVALDENGMPEDGSDITETKQATDVDTLRKLLLEDGRFAIELTENVQIDKELVVKGTKKLVGNKCITMELYAKAFQSVLTVPAGANLILDGVTLDANGIANGVTVEKNAGFTGISGEILYGVPYGVLVEGSARIKDIVIDHSMDIGVCVMEGGKTSIEGSRITNSAQTAVHIQTTAQANISGDTIIDGGFYLVRNRGTCVITGGTLCNASGYLVYGTGDVTIDYKGKDANDKMEWYGANGEAGIRIGAGAKASISGLYLHDVAGRGIRSVNDTGLNVTNCVIENTGSYGIDCVNGKKASYIENVELRNTAASAVRVHGTVSVNVKDVTVKGTEGFGIKNENTLVSAENITFENCKQDGVWGNEGSTTVVNGAVIISPGRFAVSNNSAKMTLKNVMITDPGRMGYVGKVDSTVDMTDITITGAKERAIYNLGGQVTAKNVTIENAGIFAVSTAKSQKKAGSVTIKNLTVTGVKEKDALNAYESVLTVTDAKIADVNRYGALASKGGKMTLINVELKNCMKRGVMGSGGIITLKDVVVTEAGEFGVTTAKSGEFEGSLHADNLTITGVKTKNALNNNGSVMTVTGGKIAEAGGNGIYVEKTGQTTISNVDITDCAKRGVYLTTAGSKAVLTDINISGTVNSGVFQEKGTVIEANQVSVREVESYGIFLKGANFAGKNITVANTKDNGINIDTSEAGEKSVVRVEGLTVKDTEKRAVANVGGDVTLSNAVITNPGTLGATTSKKGELAGKLVISGLTMTGVKDGNALNCNGSVLQVSDGKISDVTGNGAYAENSGQITLSKVDITDCVKRGVYLTTAGTKVVLSDTNISGTVDSGIFQETGTVVEADKVSVHDVASYGIFLKGANFAGKNITVANTKDNGINIDTSEAGEKSVVSVDRLTVKDVEKRAVANVGGDVTLLNAVITNPGTLGATTSKKGELVGKLVIHGLAMTGVKDGNALNCNGSVLQVSDGKISDVTGNGAYAENSGQITLSKVDITDCAKRGVYLITAGTKAVLDNTTLENTKQTAVYQEAGTVVEGSTLNIKDSGGYGVFMKGARFDVTDVIVHNTTQNPFNIDETSSAVIRGEKSTITKNEDTPKNVAIKVIASTLEIYDGTYNGFTNENGSVIYNSNSNVTIHGGTFKDNVATSRGAVLYATGGNAKVTIKGGTFDTNTAGSIYGGGAIGCAGNTELIVEGGLFKNNKATAVSTDDVTAYGGGAIESNGKVTITDGTFQANTAERGGAVYIDKAGSLTITGGTFGAGADVTDAEVAKALGNVASYRGGVLYIADERTSTETVSISSAHFGYNKAFNNKGISSGVMYVGSNTKVDISDTAFYNNFIEYTGDKTDDVSYGGVMYINGSEVTITDSTISGSSAMRGGAIYAHTGSVVTLNGGLYDNNTATVHAGLIYNNQGTLVINASEKGVGEFKNHTANNRGGVILNNGTTTIYNGVFTDNKAEGTKGGGVVGGTGGAVLTIKNGTFQRNASIYTSNDSNTKKSADVHGGGVIESSGRVTIEGGTFQANTAMKGGVIYLDVTGKLKITGGTFGAGTEITDADAAKSLGNSASYRGGVICIEDERTSTETITIDGASFKHNYVTNSAAVSGGVMYIGSKAKVNIGHTASCVLENNKAESTGGKDAFAGVIYVTGATLNVKNTAFTNNIGKRGGAIYTTGSSTTLTDTTCTNNVGTDYGKDIFYNTGSTLTLSGLVTAQIDKRDEAIRVEGVLNAQSNIVVRQISGSKTIIVEFDSTESMNSGKECITFVVVNSIHKGKTLTFADKKATMK